MDLLKRRKGGRERERYISRVWGLLGEEELKASSILFHSNYPFS